MGTHSLDKPLRVLLSRGQLAPRLYRTRNAGYGSDVGDGTTIRAFSCARLRSREEAHATQEEKFDDLMRDAKKHEHQTTIVTDIPAPHTGFIKVLSLNRPKARNAISRQLLNEVGERVEEIHAEGPGGPTRVLILASESDDSFCAGADLKERKSMTQEETNEFLGSLRNTFRRIAGLPIPTVSAVSGSALGGGLELALCTHLRVFSSTAVVGLPETRLAIIPGAGGTFRLPAVIGAARARELILTGRRLDTQTALAWGLCNYLVHPERDSLDDAEFKRQARIQGLAKSIEVARTISEGGPLGLRAAVKALKHGGSEEAENDAYNDILNTKDRSEALRAFAEKRAPRFEGH